MGRNFSFYIAKGQVIQSIDKTEQVWLVCEHVQYEQLLNKYYSVTKKLTTHSGNSHNPSALPKTHFG